MIKLTYDKEAKALYLQLDSETPIHYTTECGDVMIDYSVDGEVIGIEILGMSL